MQPMALFDLSPRALRRARGAALLAGSVDANLDAALLREQYRSLASLAPYIYAAVIAAAAAMGFAMRGMSSPLRTFVVLSALLAVVIPRLIYWLRARRSLAAQSLDVMRRDIRIATALGPALALGFSIVVASALPEAEPLEKAPVLFAVWITAAASALSLIRLPYAPSFVVFGSSAPLVVALLSVRTGLTFWLALLLLVVASLLIAAFAENYRVFAEIIRSRFLAAENQRAAEDAQQAVTAIAYTDYLTGLPNRRWLQTLLAARVEAGRSDGVPFAVGLLDLDGFKPINDIHGHPAGDEILKQVAGRLAAAMDGCGAAARMGGDEFAVVCENVGSEDAALALAQRLRSIFGEPFVVDALTIHLECTCGFALFPASGDNAEQLIRLADIALYRAKAGGGGRAGVFDRNVETAAVVRATLEQALREAVDQRRIGVEFEPIVDLETGRVRGFEALPRWLDSRLGVVAPASFVPVAEQIGLLDQLSVNLLREAASAAARWPDGVSLAFNLRAEQLSKPRVAAEIVAALHDSGLDPRRFTIEVTETAIIKNLDAARVTLEALRAAGVSVTLDNFGAGSSSLAQLRDLALDQIKIDRSFVARLCHDPKIAILTHAIVDMAQRLDLSCAAEGVESPEQFEELKRSGCAYGQGRLFANPMSKAMTYDFLAGDAATRKAPYR
jgi:diguanylate cyclase (GGDEF)-like protein